MSDDLPDVVTPLEIVSRRADDRGRVTVGKKYAGERLRVALLEVEEHGNENHE